MKKLILIIWILSASISHAKEFNCFKFIVIPTVKEVIQEENRKFSIHLISYEFQNPTRKIINTKNVSFILFIKDSETHKVLYKSRQKVKVKIPAKGKIIRQVPLDPPADLIDDWSDFYFDIKCTN